jgi:hypothetical protein
MLQCDNRAVAGHIENFKAIFHARAQRPVQGLLEQLAGGCASRHGASHRIVLHLFQYIVPYVESGSHRFLLTAPPNLRRSISPAVVIRFSI